MRHRLLLATLLVAVLLAGCMGDTGTGPEAVEPTENGPSDARSDASADDVPGVTDGTLSNASALAAANQDSLWANGGAVTVDWDTETTDATFELVLGAEFETYTLSGSPGGQGDTAGITLWSNDSVRIIRTTQDGDDAYRTVERRNDVPNAIESVEDYLAAGEFTVANESRANGTELRTDENGTLVLTAADFEPAPDGHGPLADATAFSGRLVVDDSGLIHELSVDATADGEPHRYHYTTNRTGVETVDRPAWVDDLPPGATLQPQLRVDVENSSYLSIENEAGDAMPAESVLSVTTNGTSYEATFEAPLDAGETRYAYVDDATGELSLASDRPSASSVDPVESPVSITIASAGGATYTSGGMAWDSGSASAEEPGSGSGSSGSASASETTG